MQLALYIEVERESDGLTDMISRGKTSGGRASSVYGSRLKYTDLIKQCTRGEGKQAGVSALV